MRKTHANPDKLAWAEALLITLAIASVGLVSIGLIYVSYPY